MQNTRSWTFSVYSSIRKNRILVDTGCGSRFLPDAGQLVPNLEAKGISPASVDTVIITHGHSDHVDGSFDPRGRPVFPGARYIVSRREWDSWVTRCEREELHPLFASARKNFLPIPEKFDLAEDNAEVLPGFKFRPARSTIGQQYDWKYVREERLLCIGDLVMLCGVCPQTIMLPGRGPGTGGQV
jgi:glyoxylase-like metal-dependent hydrolase (beta-lactamase superfamily II)